jgi:hypothetical protein
MSLISELKEVLARRRNVLEIFGTYKSMYDEMLQDLAKTYKTDTDTAVTAFYLANYVMDYIQSDQDARDRTDEDEAVKLVLENLIEARNHLTLDFESLVQVYSLIYDWGVKIEKELVKNARLFINQKVIITNIVDVYVVPLFSFLKQIIPQLDLRWAMAELDAVLHKGFAAPIFEDYKDRFLIESMEPHVYFDAGFFVVQPFVRDFFKEKFKEGIEELESFGDIGRRDFEFACSIFYDVNTRELFSPIGYDEKIKSGKILEQELNNSLHIGDVLSGSDNPFQLLFAKFHIQIKVPNQRAEERFFYIQNYEESKTDNGLSNTLGNWNYLLLSSENVNLQSIISYSKQRLIDIRGISSRLDELGADPANLINTLLSAWMEMYIHNLQEEYNFLELKDEIREQGFIPICVFKQDKNMNNLMEILVDTPKQISTKRMDTLGIKSAMIGRDEVKSFLNHIKLVTDHCSNVLRFILLQYNPDFEISIYPVEFLYEHQKRAGMNILTPFSVDESKIVGLLCQNEASLEFQARSLKQRQLFSKINQLLTDLRIKNMVDARAAKLEDYITRGVEDLYESGSLWLSGEIKESFGVTSDDESVTDRIDLAVKKEKEKIEARKIAQIKRQEALENERLARLNAQRVLYFNETILKRFFTKISLELQNNLLHQVKEKFSDVFGLEQEQRSLKMQLNDINDKSKEKTDMTEDITEIFDDLTNEIIKTFTDNIADVTGRIEKIWQLVSEMSGDEL